MMKWNYIMAMYSKPMTESEFAAFLMRRYHLLSSLIDGGLMATFSNHVYPEFKMCIGLIDKLTDKAVAEVFLEINKTKK